MHQYYFLASVMRKHIEEDESVAQQARAGVAGTVVERRQCRVFKNTEVVVVEWSMRSPVLRARTLHFYGGVGAAEQEPCCIQTMVSAKATTATFTHNHLAVELAYMQGCILFIPYMFLAWQDNDVGADIVLTRMRNSSVLCVGCGGGHLPMFLHRSGLFEGSRVAVVEVEPAVPDAAEAAMGFARDAFDFRIADGYEVLRESAASDGKKYDVICCDAFENFDIPAEMAADTKAFLETVRNALTPCGLAVTNLLHPTQQYYRRQLEIWRSVFSAANGSRVYVIPVLGHGSQSILVAANKKISGNVTVARLKETLQTIFKHTGTHIPDEVLPTSFSASK